MRNFLVRLAISMSFVFVDVFLLSESTKLTPEIRQINEKPQKSLSSHPLTLSPEQTLRVILQAYINRDPETVIAYYPRGDSEEWKKWLNKAQQGINSYMTDQKHVKQIVEIEMKNIKDDKGDKIAFLTVTLETTPRFSGAVSREADGRYVASIHWILRQYKGKGPWYFDGGGF